MKNVFTLSGLMTVLSALPALAQDGLEIVGVPKQGGVNFQTPVTDLARDQQGLDHLLLVIITLIVVFVTALLIFAIVRFNRRANPNPASFTHNTPLEIAWTIIPVFILSLIHI